MYLSTKVVDNKYAKIQGHFFQYLFEMNNFLQRALTGILFVVAVLGGIWWHEYTYLFIFAVISFLGILEIKGLVKAGGVHIQTGWAIAIGLYAYIVSFFVIADSISIYWMFLLAPIIAGVFITELYRKSDTPVINIACTFFAPLYVALPFSFLHILAFYNGEYSSSLLFAFLILIWGNDTGAYLIGSTLGRHRLFERISPKKSWEGAIGGFIITLLIAFVLSKIIANFTLINWLFIGGITSIMGVFGDLTESLIKRSVNKKDSGTLLPGHGGILDRFDAVIFAAPMVCGYLIFIKLFNC